LYKGVGSGIKFIFGILFIFSFISRIVYEGIFFPFRINFITEKGDEIKITGGFDESSPYIS